MTFIGVILLVFAAYVLIGLLFALVFVLAGVKRLDKVAARAPLHVRAIFLPGAVALWPLLAFKVGRSRERGSAS